MSGSIGDIATTSFFPSKNLGCYGDGGAIFTNSLGKIMGEMNPHHPTNKKPHECGALYENFT